MKTAVLIAAVVVADSAGDLFLTKGMREVGDMKSFSPREILRIFWRGLQNKYVMVSLLLMAVHLLGFLLLLSWADLSFVFPATALVYVISTLAAKFALGEHVNGYRWAGTILVCMGVALISVAS